MKKINWWTVKFGRQEINEISKSIMNKNISQGLQTKRFENEIGRILKKICYCYSKWHNCNFNVHDGCRGKTG